MAAGIVLGWLTCGGLAAALSRRLWRFLALIRLLTVCLDDPRGALQGLPPLPRQPKMGWKAGKKSGRKPKHGLPYIGVKKEKHGTTWTGRVDEKTIGAFPDAAANGVDW